MSVGPDDGPIDPRLAALEAEARGVFGADAAADPHAESIVVDRMVARALDVVGAVAPVSPPVRSPWGTRALVLVGVTVAAAGGAVWLGQARTARDDGPKAAIARSPEATSMPRLEEVAPALPPARPAPASANAPVAAGEDARPSARPQRPPTVVREPGPPASAADLFARANAARDAGENQTAVALYRQLLREHTSSSQGKVARVNLALLYAGVLDRPADALARLGRADEERAAWQDLLERWPDSLHAARARRRTGDE